MKNYGARGPPVRPAPVCCVSFLRVRNTKTLVGILVKGLPGAIWLLALLTLQMSLSILI